MLRLNFLVSSESGITLTSTCTIVIRRLANDDLKYWCCDYTVYSITKTRKDGLHDFNHTLGMLVRVSN